MKIKTLLVDVTDPSCIGMFDAGVNRYISEGYTLIRRMPLDANRVYAELELVEEAPQPEPLDPIEAMRTIKRICENTTKCADCKLQPLCDFLPPAEWHIGVGEGEQHDPAGA